MQDAPDTGAPIQQPLDNFEHNHYPEISAMDQVFGTNSSGRTPMAMDQGESMKPFCTYEASAFKSGPRSGNLSGTPGIIPQASPNGTTPPQETMKISGFATKNKKGSPAYNSPGSAFMMNPNIKPITSSAFSPPNYTLTNPIIPPLQIQSPLINSRPLEQSMETLNIKKPDSELSYPIENQPILENSDPSQNIPCKDDSEENLESVGELSKPREKGKKERNRVSAQKCRMRKKQYIESLEGQVNQLKEELLKCKEELKIMKEKHDLAVLKGLNETSLFKVKQEELLNKLHYALDANQPSSFIQEILVQYEVFSILKINYRMNMVRIV